MGFILELARARQRIQELETQIAPPIPQVPRFVMSAYEVTKELDALGIIMLYRRLDSTYVYTDAAGWIEVISYIYTYMPMPEYFVKADGTWNVDCENFGIWFMDMVALKFGINYCGLAFGNKGVGEHGWNLLRDKVGVKLFEPQPAYDINHPFNQDENGYHAREVLL